MFGEGAAVDEADKEYVAQRLAKVEKLLGKYDGEEELLAEVEMSRDKRNFLRLEIMIQTPHTLYRVEKTNQVLSEAMDEIEEVLKKQINRDKERMKDLVKRGGRSLKKKVAIDENARF
jgi:ribosomal subunit interface protein